MRIVLALLLLITFAASAHAETRTERYGTTIAIADGVSIAFLGTGAYLIATNDGGGARTVGILSTAAGAGGYIWASPIVHHMRDRRELAKIDIGLRIFIPASRPVSRLVSRRAPTAKNPATKRPGRSSSPVAPASP